ncbi:uncharacterized protein DS421_11g331880 [Arachis hypogaea]|nr:uncharacterized protein DS421_11g331880 [Arachis hypogaea]
MATHYKTRNWSSNTEARYRTVRNWSRERKHTTEREREQRRRELGLLCFSILFNLLPKKIWSFLLTYNLVLYVLY